MAIEKDFFRQVMGHFATGVTIVTTNNQGALGGLTVNAFCSVSLNPPLVLICVDDASNTLSLFRESKVFAVNILTDKQEGLSRCFATRSQERFDRFCSASYHTAVTGAPILDDVLAFIDARIVAEYPGGDHTIFLGQVEALGTASRVIFADDAAQLGSTLAQLNGKLPLEEESPLAYYRGQYRHLAYTYQKPSLGENGQNVEQPAQSTGAIYKPAKGALDQPTRGAIHKPAKGALDQPTRGAIEKPAGQTGN